MLKVKEAAEKLNVHPNTIRNWIKAGELKAMDIGKGYRIKEDDLNEFVEKRSTA